MRKICVVSYPRSGTNAILQGLSRASKIISHFELFHPAKPYYDWEIEAECKNLGISLPNKTQRDLDPLSFLDEVEGKSRSVKPEADIFMFKFFPEHGIDTEQAILNSCRFDVLYIFRENLLEQYVSLKLAEASGAWNTGDVVQANINCVNIDPWAFLRHVKYTYDVHLGRIEQIRKLGLVMKEFSFEEFVCGKVRSLADWLGLEEFNFSSIYTRQNDRPMSSKIENYEQIRALLSGTIYREWLV